MRVAIIDNGIDEHELNVPVRHYNLLGTSFITARCDSHGTICAKIIESFGNVSTIFDIICLDQNGNSSIKLFLDALELCLQLDIEVINISNGIDFYSELSTDYIRIRELCNMLIRSGKQIFAAHSNDGFISIPANLPTVYSVEQSYVLNNILSDLYRHSKIKTNGGRKITINNLPYKAERCNSYACAFATACATINKKCRTTWNVWKPIIQIFSCVAFAFSDPPMPILSINCTKETWIESTRLALNLKALLLSDGYRASTITDTNHMSDTAIIYIGSLFYKANRRVLAFLQKPDIIISVNTKRRKLSPDDFRIVVNEDGKFEIGQEIYYSEVEVYNKLLKLYQ